jgi:hypothetical protein
MNEGNTITKPHTLMSMKTLCLVVLAMIVMGLHAQAAEPVKPFPPHWGEPPKVQTRDHVLLPGGYGTGSSTLAKWISTNMDKDKLDANRPKPAEPAPSKPTRERPTRSASDPTAPAKPTPDRTATGKPTSDQATQPKTNLPPVKPAATDTAKPAIDDNKKLTKQERKAIEDYVAKHQAGEDSGRGKGKGKGKGQTKNTLPPGLAKKVERGGELPPGWENKLTVGETMPEKVLQQAQPLPKDVSVKMPAAPAGTTNVVIEGKVLRVMEKSRQILDVLDLNKK